MGCRRRKQNKYWEFSRLVMVFTMSMKELSCCIKKNGAMLIVSEEGRGTMVEIRIPEKQEMEYEGRI